MTPGPDLGLTIATVLGLAVLVTAILHMAIADWLDRRDERRPPAP